MIKMKSPSLAINSYDVPGPNYKMWQTVNASKGMTPVSLLGEILRVNEVALQYKQKPLQNIVINCHGGDGRLYIGGLDYPPMDINNIGIFSVLKTGDIGTIWLVACEVLASGFGKRFCQSLAMTSGSEVVAADVNQDVGPWSSLRIYTSWTRGLIDDYEGTVFSFRADGSNGIIDPKEDIFTAD